MSSMYIAIHCIAYIPTHYIVLYCIVLYYTILYYIILYYIILYYIILIVLHYIIQSFWQYKLGTFTHRDLNVRQVET